MSRFFSKQIYRKLCYVLPSSVRLFMMHYGNQCATLADDLYQLCACRKWLIVICSTFFILSWKPQQKITQTIFQIDDKLLVLTWVFNPQTRFSLEQSFYIYHVHISISIDYNTPFFAYTCKMPRVSINVIKNMSMFLWTCTCLLSTKFSLWF